MALPESFRTLNVVRSRFSCKKNPRQRKGKNFMKVGAGPCVEILRDQTTG
jgi:hypothetical protein